MSLLCLIFPLLGHARTERLPETNTETPGTRLRVATVPVSPITEEAIWPVKPNTYMKALKGQGNCVKCMRAAGFQVPIGYVRGAGTIPVPRRDISEGEIAVAVTYEGWVGHVVLVQRIHDQDVVVFECNYFSRNPGDLVQRSLVKGYLSPDAAGLKKLVTAEEPLQKPANQRLTTR